MHVSAIVLAAGKGLRLDPRIPKPLLKIGSRPVIIHSLETLNKHPRVKEIIVAVNAQNQKKIVNKIKRYRITKVSRIVLGGKERQDSVRNALKAVACSAGLVLIHDAARPFITGERISALIKEAQSRGAAILGVPVKATIKEIHGKSRVKKTLKRENLREIQTPQVFRKDLILEAYRKFGDSPVTDDAALVEKLGAGVSVVLGSYENIKITTPADLAIAEAFLGQKRCRRIK
ncbi:MAG: 2-C-methyl-D-erythritol 4-phosphate cytidylyltransferase [Candidatus Omnitrophota bacterium]|jgi:2-C-methyl-D-erythritol 4-phosphate cytidylyltransferase